MTSDDVVLALSNSGQTDELLRFIPMVLHMNVPIISMTSNPDSLLAKYSNAHIKVWVEHEACPLNLAPTSSTTAALAMGDALAVALMTVRDFKPRDFAQFHPGGELGRKLLTTAEDVMRTEDLPIISKDMNLGEAIIHVSKGKLGLGVSLEGNQVIGLITDGDIRRAMEKWQAEFFNKTVSDIMTRNPKQVSPKTKISEIQKIMHEHKIHNVLVVDKENHLMGVVDSYAAFRSLAADSPGRARRQSCADGRLSCRHRLEEGRCNLQPQQFGGTADRRPAEVRRPVQGDWTSERKRASGVFQFQKRLHSPHAV